MDFRAVSAVTDPHYSEVWKFCICRSLHAALEQLGKNSQQLSGLQTELSTQHHSQLDMREATLQAREVELRGTQRQLS
jgi:hypothetical protein